MLYDPKWERKTDRVFGGVSLQALIAWLETKPSDEKYDYGTPTQCAIAQYLQSRGYSEMESVIDFGLDPQPCDEGYWLERIMNATPYTFGGALERARRAAAA